jgi:hypothetical protein
MSEFEYLLVLVSVLVGVALSDLATSLHRLLRERHRVHWDWLAPCAALMATLAILRFWWKFYSAGQSEIWSQFGAFLLLLVQLLQLVLLACCALPDGASDLDLRRYYSEQSRYFWFLFSSYVLGAAVFNWISGDVTRLMLQWPSLITNLISALVFFGLGFWRRRRLHELGVPLVLAYFLATFLPAELS